VEFKEYYATLGVAKTATAKEIKQAYRKLARKHHPDVNPGDKAAETKFKEINEAYEVLGDPEKRRKYDELGANWRYYEQAQQAGTGPFGAGSPFGGAPEGGAWRVDYGQGGGRPMTEDEVREMFGGEDPFSDFFRTFFGGGGAEGRRRASSRAPRARKGADVEHEIDLSLEQAFHGVTQRLSIKHDGHARTVDVRIPPGVKDGSRVRVAGEGERGVAGGASGDLYLRVRIAPHPRFERDGQDVRTNVSIPVTTAVLGGEAEVQTIDGAAVRLKVPEGTQNGQVFRLRGHGMPAIGKPAERGDLYAKMVIEVPKTLTAEQRKHYEALARLQRPAKHSAA
jgi:DnaJ-class molecular chaperone